MRTERITTAVLLLCLIALSAVAWNLQRRLTDIERRATALIAFADNPGLYDPGPLGKTQPEAPEVVAPCWRTALPGRQTWLTRLPSRDEGAFRDLKGFWWITDDNGKVIGY